MVFFVSHSQHNTSGKEIYEATRRKCGAYSFCEILVDDWDRFLTPWPLEIDMENRNFTGEGRLFYEKFVREIIPDLEKRIPTHGKIIIVGYSLAGLFALWAFYQCEKISGAVSCSGALWYPGWERFAEDTLLHGNRKQVDWKQEDQNRENIKVYLSLGRKEPKTRHPLMQRVGIDTEAEAEHLAGTIGQENVAFIWENGGHFTEVKQRIARGIVWILQ